VQGIVEAFESRLGLISLVLGKEVGALGRIVVVNYHIIVMPPIEHGHLFIRRDHEAVLELFGRIALPESLWLDTHDGRHVDMPRIELGSAAHVDEEQFEHADIVVKLLCINLQLHGFAYRSRSP
jgi:hypothetical protein